MKQELIWIPEAEDTGAFAKSVPTINYDGKIPDRLWTLYTETDKDKLPLLPIFPIHLKGAFLEDRIHDWIVRDGSLHYYSRASAGKTWALIEFFEEDGVCPECSEKTTSQARFCTSCGIRI